MGAVQKLATAVIVGLVGLSTLLVVYLADEPNRRAAEAHEQEEVAIERGIKTYIQNCLVCHGPAGEGYSEPGAKGTGRVGMPLGGSTELGLKATENNQSHDDPIHFAERTALIKKTLNNGRGLMPAFGIGAEGGELLNPEQINELTLMIQHVDWDEVYNQSVEYAGGYPTFPPAPAPAAAAAPATTPAAGGAAEPAGDTFTVVSHDIYFDPAELTIPAATDVKLALPNEGAAPHNFSIDALKISQDQAPGETYEITVNAPAGEYEYYCNVPGHKEAGMVGKLIADPNMKASAPAAAAPAASPVAGSEPAAAPAAASAVTVVSHDISFDPAAFEIPAGTDVVVSLPNEGAAPHNFSIDALKISQDQAPGETHEVTINAPAGEYEYYCNVPGHKEAGMVGKMTAK
ncbi:MAG: cupredoxin domain-containing protein [Chloroflexota bacterium]